MSGHTCTACQSRRQFLGTGLMLGAGLMLPSWATAGGFRTLSGDVRINGTLASQRSRVYANSTIHTGADSSTSFVIGDNAFLLRPHSKVRFTPVKRNNVAIATLRLVTGGLLSVFGPGPKKLLTPTATIGIRGTGVYMEAQDHSSYVCLCYGTVDLSANNQPSTVDTLEASHHQGKEVSQDGLITTADMRAHTDDELVMLEALVGRKVPFAV